MPQFSKFAALILLAACAPAPEATVGEPVDPAAAENAWAEGVFEYVPPMQGQFLAANGRFVFLYGPADGTGPMTGEAGTYVISGDTVTNTVTYSTDPEGIGGVYRWTIESTSSDTITFVTMSPAGEFTGRGRSVRVR